MNPPQVSIANSNCFSKEVSKSSLGIRALTVVVIHNDKDKHFLNTGNEVME